MARAARPSAGAVLKAVAVARWFGLLSRVALLSLVCVPVARGDREHDATALLQEGIQLFQAGELLRARTVFVAAQGLAPDRPNPYRWLGLVDARLGRCEEAIPNLERFLHDVPTTDMRVAEVSAERDRCLAQLAAASGREPPVPKSLAVHEARTALVATPPPRKPLYRRWWLWTAVGVTAAAGLAIGLGVGLTRGGGSAIDPVHVQ